MTLAASVVAVGLLVIYSQQAVYTQQAVTSGAQSLAPGIEWAWGYRVGSAIPTHMLPQPLTLAPDAPIRIPGSRVTCTFLSIDRPGDGTHDGVLDVCDWYPDDRGSLAMPDLVRRGRKITHPDGTWTGKEGIRACGQCHLPTGAGRSENGQPAGLSRAYILQQLDDFRNGLRNSSDPKKDNAHRMTSFAKAMTAAEMTQVADFFAAMPYPPVGVDRYIKVVETDRVPVAYAQGGMFHAVEGAGEEPIGNRIIEVPADPFLNEYRDGKSGFIAYVPRGSVKQGEAIAARARCAMCHGAELNGSPVAPTIAGRSASYLARQLYDFHTGERRGKMSPLMRTVVASLTLDDIRNVVAYVASIAPQKRQELLISSTAVVPSTRFARSGQAQRIEPADVR
jgi:cytochrome c553